MAVRSSTSTSAFMAQVSFFRIRTSAGSGLRFECGVNSCVDCAKDKRHIFAMLWFKINGPVVSLKSGNFVAHVNSQHWYLGRVHIFLVGSDLLAMDNNSVFCHQVQKSGQVYHPGGVSGVHMRNLPYLVLALESK